MSDIRQYQADHLLLLVGSNPVPNAIAGKLLTTPTGTITLVHSADGLDLAQRLQAFLEADCSTISLTQVKESDAHSVYTKVLKILDDTYGDADQVRSIRLGLNYTGGTKVMAVHAYRALEDWAKEHNHQTICSYLDAHTLRMCFDPVPGKLVSSFPIGPEVEIGVLELLKLHNWKVDSPTMTPVLPESAAALLKVHSNTSEARIWTHWLHHTFFRRARKMVDLPQPFDVYKDNKQLEGQYKVTYPTSENKWISTSELRNLLIPWPDLPSLREVMSKQLGQPDAESLNLAAAKGKGCKDEKDFCKWLSGGWLESAVLATLQNCPKELYLKHCCMNLTPKILKDPKRKEANEGDSEEKKLFEFDVVAMRGYQLFAFSCTTEDAEKSGGRWLLKQKLFEASIRAQQMGGDEACVALICCMEKNRAAELQREMLRDLRIEGRIRVFGREDLANLAQEIEQWVHEQTKEK